MKPAPSTNPRRRGVALVRVSREREGMVSPENQRYAIQEYADRHSIDIIEWVEGVEEAKYSASRRKSAWWPKLDGAIERLESGDAEVILVWKFSRTARQRLKWAVALDRVDLAGGTLESVTEQTDPTPSGRFARGMMGEMNAYQAELIGEVWRETHERRRRHGLPPTGGPRFGYLVEDGVYVPDPETAPILADLYRRYLGGMGSAQLTRYLNDLALGRTWTYQGVMKVLDSGFAAGLLGRTKPRLLPPWEREYTRGAHESVIDEETWAAYMARRRERRSVPTRTARRYMLTGLVRCGDCGGPMSGKTFDGRPSYVCSRSTTTNTVRRVTVVASRVDDEVSAWVAALALPDERSRMVEAARVKAAHRKSVAAGLRESIVKQDERMRVLTLKLVDGTVTDAEYRVAADAINAERAALEQRLQLAVVNPVEQAAPAVVDAGIGELWPHLSVDERSLIVRPLVREVVVYPVSHRGARERRIEIVPTWAD